MNQAEPRRTTRRALLRTLTAGVAAPALASAAKPLSLVRNGKSRYSICLGRDASLSEKRAAAELQRFLQEMSGARLPIIGDDGDGPEENVILIGNSRFIQEPGLGPEDFVLKTAGRGLIIIVGGRARGTMYGVYTFLDRLGCRWFTRDVSRIPQVRNIDVQPMEETHQPAFEYREPYITEAFDKDWAARNRTNGNSSQLDDSTGGKLQYFPFVHSFNHMIPPEKYFAEHPEYFSQIDGKRRADRSQLCLTNPDVLRLGVAAVLDWVRQHPEAAIYSVSQNDWEGWCECDNCRRVEEEEGGRHSGPILRYVNTLAAEIEKQHPDKLIDTLAYWYSEDPPLKVRPRRNVRVRLCPIGVCEAHPYEKCARSAYFMENLRAWSKITNQLYIWHYNTNFTHYLAPFPDFDELAEDIPLYKRHGVVGVFLEGSYPRGGGGEQAELRAYVTARLLWDTKTDVDAAVDEFVNGVYGAAARPMRAYYDLLRQQARDGMHIWINPVPEFSEKFLPQSRDLFRQAEEAAAGDDAVRRRVRKARLPVDYLELLGAKTFTVRDGQYAPADLNGLQDRFRTFLADVRGFGITSLHEGRDLGVDEKEFAALKSCRVVTLEDAALRVDLTPEMSGRVIRMIGNSAGRDALRRPDSGERGYPDLGGLGLFVYSDYRGAALGVRWEVEDQSAASAHLAGTCANGLRLRRTVEIRDGVLRTQTTAENTGSAPLDVLLQSRADFDPMGIDTAVVRFRRRNGSDAERRLIEPAKPPAGSETYSGEDQPAGEWRIENPKANLALASRFPGDQVSRCLLNWSAKGPHRVTLGLWSKPGKLAPGETTRLDADYSL